MTCPSRTWFGCFSGFREYENCILSRHSTKRVAPDTIKRARIYVSVRTPLYCNLNAPFFLLLPPLSHRTSNTVAGHCSFAVDAASALAVYVVAVVVGCNGDIFCCCFFVQPICDGIWCGRRPVKIGMVVDFVFAVCCCPTNPMATAMRYLSDFLPGQV